MTSLYQHCVRGYIEDCLHFDRFFSYVRYNALCALYNLVKAHTSTQTIPLSGRDHTEFRGQLLSRIFMTLNFLEGGGFP